MPTPTELPVDTPTRWKKIHDGEAAKVWRNGAGQLVSITQSFNATTDYWEVTDSTGAVVEKRATGAFETYLDALAFVNTFIPHIGRDELPEDDGGFADDEVVSIGSYPGGSSERECAGSCEDDIFVCYRVEYGDERHEWLCPPCAQERFEWTVGMDGYERPSTVGFDMNGQPVEGVDAMHAAENILEEHSEALLGAGIVDVNGLATALHCLAEYRYDGQREHHEPSEAFGFMRDVRMLMVEYKQDHPDIPWYDIRDALDELSSYAHECAREETGTREGRRALIEEIQDSELTPNAWFTEHVDGGFEQS
jgi:hypothetical protein